MDVFQCHLLLIWLFALLTGGVTSYYTSPSPDHIRLVGGTSHSGRVEVYHGGEWGTVCDDGFDTNAARVVCSVLGLFRGDEFIVAYSNAHFGQGYGPIQMDEIRCNGYERSLFECGFNGWQHHDCSHSEDAGVDCYHSNNTYETATYSNWNQIMYNDRGTTEGPRGQSMTPQFGYHNKYVSVRLVNGGTGFGTVEVNVDGTWGTICDDDFDVNDAEVICGMLGYYTGNNSTHAYGNAYFGSGYGPIIMDDIQCAGWESNIGSCRFSGWYNHNCNHGEDAGVSCNGYEERISSLPPYASRRHTTNWFTTHYNWFTTTTRDSIRLVNGSYHAGRLEVYHNGVWGTVCDDSFDHNDAKVACRMLGLYNGDNYGQVLPQAYYGEGSGQIWMDDVNCYGYEYRLSDCPFNGWGSNNCGHGEDVGIDCYAWSLDVTTEQPWMTTGHSADSIRLVNGSYYAGRLEVYHNGVWGTVCDDSFDHNDAKVACRMLGLYNGNNYGQVLPQAYYGEGSGQIWMDDVNCYGYENRLSDCPFNGWGSNNCRHGEDVGIDCYAWSLDVTTEQPWMTTGHSAGMRVEDTITVSCSEFGWDIRVNMNKLRQIFPGAKASDIYMGDNSCIGYETWNGYLHFTQGLRECLTNEVFHYDALIYTNKLIYAEHDPIHPFIIRHFNWTIGVECDVGTNKTTTGHLHNDDLTGNTGGHNILGSDHYHVNMTFFTDPNFFNQIVGNPLHVSVGSSVYVKVFTTTTDWTIKMRVHTCYTKPSVNESSSFDYQLIKDGCEVDANTHIISQSSHETRFVFQEFEYTNNHEGLYVFCEAILCNIHDYSHRCSQSCSPVNRSGGSILEDDNVAGHSRKMPEKSNDAAVTREYNREVTETTEEP